MENTDHIWQILTIFGTYWSHLETACYIWYLLVMYGNLLGTPGSHKYPAIPNILIVLEILVLFLESYNNIQDKDEYLSMVTNGNFWSHL